MVDLGRDLLNPRYMETPGAYRWWYFDAYDEAMQNAWVAIFFVGSVFSPEYGARRGTDRNRRPIDHAAVNFAWYRRGHRPRWVFSEYPAAKVLIRENEISIGDSSVRFSENEALVSIRESEIPTRRPYVADMRVVRQEAPRPAEYLELDPGHEWKAHMPKMAATISIGSKTFHANGYHDENRGLIPLSDSFRTWSWGRFHRPEGTKVFFDLEMRRAHDARKRFAIDHHGLETMITNEPRPTKLSLTHFLAPLPKSTHAWSEGGKALDVVPEWYVEKAPFYSRFVGGLRLGGTSLNHGMCEHIAFDRVTHPLVQKMIRGRVSWPERNEWGWVP